MTNNQVKRYGMVERTRGMESWQNLEEVEEGEWVRYSDYEAKDAEAATNEKAYLWERDQKNIALHRIAHLEALLVAVREEDAKLVANGYFNEAYKLSEEIRSLPLPDKRAERIRDVVEAAIEDRYNHTVGDGQPCYCELCNAVRDLEAE